jgi:hypothetical protein
MFGLLAPALRGMSQFGHEVKGLQAKKSREARYLLPTIPDRPQRWKV